MDIESNPDNATLQEALISSDEHSDFRRRHHRARILDRDAAFFQSRGRWGVQHISTTEARWIHQPGEQSRRQTLTRRFWNDWFYDLAYQKTFVLMAILFLIYAGLVASFAMVYLLLSVSGKKIIVDPDTGSTTTEMFCHLDIHNHMEALYFSLSTMTTIGYGVSDYYFGSCWLPFVLVLTQACCAIIFDAIAIGLLFHRISRGQKRGKTILFSDKAPIRRVQGVPYLYFRLAELRQNHILKANVRSYCVRHSRELAGSGIVETTHFVTKPMLLQQDIASSPSSQILMGLPQVLVHRIDHNSPLMPPLEWYDAKGKRHGLHPTDGLYCENEASQDHLDAIRLFVEDRLVEVVLTLEGTDELTGTTIQTRHSYTIDELLWNEQFSPCIFPPPREEEQEYSSSSFCPTSRQTRFPSCVVDFAKFHESVPAPSNANACPYI